MAFSGSLVGGDGPNLSPAPRPGTEVGVTESRTVSAAADHAAAPTTRGGRRTPAAQPQCWAHPRGHVGGTCQWPTVSDAGRSSNPLMRSSTTSREYLRVVALPCTIQARLSSDLDRRGDERVQQRLGDPHFDQLVLLIMSPGTPWRVFGTVETLIAPADLTFGLALTRASEALWVDRGL